MAEFPKSISIDVEPIIKPSVANLCIAVLELYMNQHPEIDVIGKRSPDGSIRLKTVVWERAKSPKAGDA